MRKKMLTTTGAVLVAGIIAALLRLIEVNTIFEPETGLAKEYAFISILLIALTIAVIAKSVWHGMSVVKKGKVNVDMQRPFPITNMLSQILVIVVGIIVAVGAGANYVLDLDETTTVKAVFAVLGILSGVSMIVMAIASAKKGGKLGTWACFPAIFMCYWLVLTYKENNTNPVLLEYCYECLGAATATLSFYYAAGHYYGKLTPKRTIITHLLGAYFCLLTSLNAGNMAQGAIFAAIAVYQLVMVCSYIKGMTENKIEE